MKARAQTIGEDNESLQFVAIISETYCIKSIEELLGRSCPVLNYTTAQSTCKGHSWNEATALSKQLAISKLAKIDSVRLLTALVKPRAAASKVKQEVKEDDGASLGELRNESDGGDDRRPRQ